MRTDQTREIAWNLRALGQLKSWVHNDGNGLVYDIWVDGGTDSDGKPIVASGFSMDEAMQGLWLLLTAPGSYVMIGSRKHVYGKGVWQSILE